MSDTKDTAVRTVDEISFGNRERYLLTAPGQFYGWPAASMVTGDFGTHVALSRGFEPGDSLVVALQSEHEARELCILHAAMLSKIAKAQVRA